MFILLAVGKKQKYVLLYYYYAILTCKPVLENSQVCDQGLQDTA